MREFNDDDFGTHDDGTIGHDGAVRLVVVRHGQAGRKSRWSGDDALRPLDAAGLRQARDLVKELGSHPVERILSSPYLRCVQTVEPLSEHHRIEIETSDALAPDAGAKSTLMLEELVESSKNTLVLCTHREVLVELLPEVAERFGTGLGHRVPGAKGSAWIFDFSQKKRLTSVKYRSART